MMPARHKCSGCGYAAKTRLVFSRHIKRCMLWKKIYNAPKISTEAASIAETTEQQDKLINEERIDGCTSVKYKSQDNLELSASNTSKCTTPRYVSNIEAQNINQCEKVEKELTITSDSSNEFIMIKKSEQNKHFGHKKTVLRNKNFLPAHGYLVKKKANKQKYTNTYKLPSMIKDSRKQNHPIKRTLSRVLKGSCTSSNFSVTCKNSLGQENQTKKSEHDVMNSNWRMKDQSKVTCLNINPHLTERTEASVNNVANVPLDKGQPMTTSSPYGIFSLLKDSVGNTQPQRDDDIGDVTENLALKNLALKISPVVMEHPVSLPDVSNIQSIGAPPSRARRRQYRCKKCNFFTVKSKLFLQHRMVHHSEKLQAIYQCFICEYASTSKHKLNRHCNLVHMSETMETGKNYDAYVIKQASEAGLKSSNVDNKEIELVDSDSTNLNDIPEWVKLNDQDDSVTDLQSITMVELGDESNNLSIVNNPEEELIIDKEVENINYFAEYNCYDLSPCEREKHNEPKYFLTTPDNNNCLKVNHNQVIHDYNPKRDNTDMETSCLNTSAKKRKNAPVRKQINESSTNILGEVINSDEEELQEPNSSWNSHADFKSWHRIKDSQTRDNEQVFRNTDIEAMTTMLSSSMPVNIDKLYDPVLQDLSQGTLSEHLLQSNQYIHPGENSYTNVKSYQFNNIENNGSLLMSVLTKNPDEYDFDQHMIKESLENIKRPNENDGNKNLNSQTKTIKLKKVKRKGKATEDLKRFIKVLPGIGTSPVFGCTLCRFTHPLKGKVIKHITQIHKVKFHTSSKQSQKQAQPNFKCNHCNFECSRRTEWTDHKITHSSKRIFACKECSYRTTFYRNYARHMLHHVNSEESGPVKCNYCSYSSTGEGAVQRHMREFHRNPEEKKTTKKLAQGKMQSIADSDLYINHGNINGTITVPVQTPTIPQNPFLYQNSAPLVNQNGVQSDQHFSVLDQSSLAIPNESIVNQLPLVNENDELVDLEVSPAEKELYSVFNLRKKPKLHSSPVINNNFVNSVMPSIPVVQSFSSVVSPIRTDLCPCPNCDLICKSQSQLRSHMVIHSHDHPHECSICKLRYKRSSDLKRHCRKKHPELETSPMKDNATDLTPEKANGSDTDLNCFKEDEDHIITLDIQNNVSETYMSSEFLSNPIKPNKKGDLSIRPLNLSVKKTKHDQIEYDKDTEELTVEYDDQEVSFKRNVPLKILIKPPALKCNQCSYNAKYPGDLRRHMNIHSVEKRFKCHLCASRFKYQGDLNKHLRNIHKLPVGKPRKKKKVPTATLR